VASIYILEAVCYVNRYKDSLECNVQICNYITQRKLELHIYSSGTRLYNKVPDHIKNCVKSNLLKESWNPSVRTCILCSGWIYYIL